MRSARSRDRRLAPAFPPGDDDLVCVYSRSPSLGGRYRRSQLARRDVGTPVFGGMILASFIGIFAIPPLYVTFQAIRERLRPGSRPKEISKPANKPVEAKTARAE